MFYFHPSPCANVYVKGAQRAPWRKFPARIKRGGSGIFSVQIVSQHDFFTFKAWSRFFKQWDENIFFLTLWSFPLQLRIFTNLIKNVWLKEQKERLNVKGIFNFVLTLSMKFLSLVFRFWDWNVKRKTLQEIFSRIRRHVAMSERKFLN